MLSAAVQLEHDDRSYSSRTVKEGLNPENFVYLDDITVCSSSQEELEGALTRLHAVLTSIGRRINFDKSGRAFVGGPSSSARKESLQVNNEELPYMTPLHPWG